MQHCDNRPGKVERPTPLDNLTISVILVVRMTGSRLSKVNLKQAQFWLSKYTLVIATPLDTRALSLSTDVCGELFFSSVVSGKQAHSFICVLTDPTFKRDEGHFVNDGIFFTLPAMTDVI